MTCWVQEWQLWFSYFWTYLPVLCLNLLLCQLCNSNTLHNNLMIHGRNIEQDKIDVSSTRMTTLAESGRTFFFFSKKTFSNCFWFSCVIASISPLSHVFHCDVLQMSKRTPMRTEHAFVLWNCIGFRASKTSLSPHPHPPHTSPPSSPPPTQTPVVFLLTALRRFLCCSYSLLVHLWFDMLRLWCPYLFSSLLPLAPQ